MASNIKKLTHLSKNNDFVLNFEAGLDLFFYYKNDLQRIFEEATQFRDELLAVESRLKYTFIIILLSIFYPMSSSAH